MGASKASYQFRLEGIGKLISDRFFSVPIYQRSYSWTSDHVDEFWHDINDALNSGKTEYFLGTTVLTDTTDKTLSSVIDGQQRISTTIIMFSALQKFLADEGETKNAQHIRDHYVAASTFGSENDRARIRMNTDDDPLFYSYVVQQKEHVVPPSKESHRLVIQAFQKFFFLFQNVKKENPGGWGKYVEALVEFVNLSVQVVVVDVPDEADAFLIFETLNDRGADLTTADLLKNYLFGKSSTELDVVRDRWISALSTIQTVADDQLFTTFLRHFWSSLYGITRERELYAAIKRRITDKKSAVEFAERLSVEARNYAALISPSHERWDELGELPRENLQTLNRLELEQVRPLLLAVVQHFPEKELKVALAYLVSWNFRSLITGTSGGGVFESAFCQASVKVRKGDLKTTKELFGELAAIIPSDNAFENALRTSTVPKAKLARYILHAVERYRMGTGAPEMISNTDEESVNLEHILPKNAKEADWPQFSADDRASFVHRLGNMALLDATKNRKIGNKPWEVKKPILSASKLLVAQEAGSQEVWLTTTIDSAQSKLALEAVKIWRRQPAD